MTKSTITIDVLLDDTKVPEQINWAAGNTTADELQKGAEKTALRIDLWTKDMMVDEMADFFYQTLLTMADTLKRATKNEELTSDMKNFAIDFYKKFREQQLKDNKV
jgi:gliding motility-associated protein GldC